MLATFRQLQRRGDSGLRGRLRGLELAGGIAIGARSQRSERDNRDGGRETSGDEHVINGYDRRGREHSNDDIDRNSSRTR